MNHFSDDAWNPLAVLCYGHKQGCSSPPPAHVDAALVESLVLEGIDVLYLPVGTRRPILHEFIFRGFEDCVAACLKTPHPIDWKTRDMDANTALHLLCLYEIPNDKAYTMLRLIVERMETHPMDTVDWSVTGVMDKGDFLSFAATNQRLSLFFPIVRDQPYFADQTSPIVLQGNVWEWDWNALSEEDRMYLGLVDDEDELIRAERVTGELMALCSRTRWRPDVLLLRELVRGGADVHFSEAIDSRESFLHRFVRDGNVDCAVVCIEESKQPIMFRKKDYLHRNVLHHICGYFMADRTMTLLRVLLRREEAQCSVPGDENPRNLCIDWCAKDEVGYSFFCHSAATQVLSVVWPVVKDRALKYAEKYHKTFFPVQLNDNVSVFQWDWDALGESEQRYFKVPRKTPMRMDDAATAGLVKMCRMRDPDVDEVRRCVRDGGDVNALDVSGIPLLSRFLSGSSVSALEACFETNHPLNFCAVGRENWAPLHYLVHSAVEPKLCGEMLRLVVKRVVTHTEDRIDWNARDSKGETFMYPAVWYAKREIFEEVLKEYGVTVEK